MTVFDERSAPPVSRRRLRLFAVPVVVALAGLIFLLSHQPHRWQTALREFRGETPADAGPNRSMDSSLAVRRYLLMHHAPKLSAVQGALLVSLVGSPVDDQAQSEALDVLGLAQRGNALSPDQQQKAQDATLLALGRSPGPMVRLESARLLGHLGSRAGIPALTLLQTDSDSKVREAAGEALRRVRK